MLRAYIGLFFAAIALTLLGLLGPAVILAAVAMTLAFQYELRVICRAMPRPTLRVVRVAEVIVADPPEA